MWQKYYLILITSCQVALSQQTWNMAVVDLLLGQRRGRWANSKPTLSQRLMFVVIQRFECIINPFNPEFTIVIFIHYKPRIAAAILDL